MYQKNEVVQFTEDHQWCGCFGRIDEVKELPNGAIRYLIGVPIPGGSETYIFSNESDHEFEFIGNAVMIPKENNGV